MFDTNTHPHHETPPWTWRDLGAVILLIIIGTAFVFLTLRVLVLISGATLEAGMASPVGYIGSAAIYGILILAIYLVVVRRTGWAALGIRRAPWQAYIATPLYLLGALIGMAFINIVIIRLSGSTFENPQVEALTGGQPFTPQTLALLLVLIAGLVPIAEELFFRGLLYPLLRYQWGADAAIVVSALIFAVAHFIPLLIPALFFVGLFLGLLREKSGSLLPCILFHAMQNGIVLLSINAELS